MSEASAHLVEIYATGGERVAQMMKGSTDTDLRRVPPDSAAPEVGKWSVHQLLIHLQDAELAFADRMRRIIAMDEPSLLSWHEGAFLRRLHYEDQSSADAIELIRLTRRQMGRILNKLPDADFERSGNHDQRGLQKLSTIIQFADSHLNHHLEFVPKKKRFFAKVGAPT